MGGGCVDSGVVVDAAGAGGRVPFVSGGGEREGDACAQLDEIGLLAYCIVWGTHTPAGREPLAWRHWQRSQEGREVGTQREEDGRACAASSKCCFTAGCDRPTGMSTPAAAG